MNLTSMNLITRRVGVSGLIEATTWRIRLREVRNE